MAEISNEQLAQAVTSPRFAALAQTGRAVGDVHHWDRRLLREPRLLVPVDVQALVVRDADEPMVRLPFRQADDVVAPIDDPGEKRPPGVHLLWTTPAAFGRGKVVDDPAAPGDKGRRILELPVLPDRWVVVRIAILAADWEPLVRGWVLEADTATVIPLADYPTRTNATTVGPAVPADRLTVHVGGPTWTSCYDAALGRHAFHDNLDELADLATAGLIGDAITYVVAGWWSDPRRDPLDGVGSIIGYHRRLQELGWDDPDHPLSDAQASTSQRSERSVASIFGLDVGGRYSRAQWAGFDLYPNTSSFVHEAIEAAVAPAAPTRSTMLHGRIHGVPWKSLHRPDDRPAPSQVKVALGPTGPAVSAVVASGALTNGNAQLQRDAERLLTAFSSGLIDRIENPDAWPDIEQYEHAQGFASQPGGVDAVDHLVDRPNRGNDPGASFRRGRRTKLPGAMIDLAATILWSAEKPPMILPVKKAATTARAAGGPGVSASMNKPPSSAAAANLGLKEVARNVERPAPPYHTPIAPVIAVVGAGRRLLAAERDESDGVLRVRTSDQPVRGMSGLLKADALLRSLGSGAIPDEVVTVAREALAEDPYLTSWRSQIATADVPSGASVDLRIRAEAAINYAYYAGDDERLSTCVGVGVDSSQTRQAAVEGLLKHSLVDGVWSHPEGVTMWGQPWRPLFCEWSVDLDLAGLVTLGDWTLEEIDLEREASFPGGEVITLTGRSPLVTSAASTLAAAVERWITDERARDKLGHGLASGAVEKAMVGLRNHLADLDVLSVTIDGVRESLLGLQYDRGLVRATVDAGPGGAPRALAIALPRLVAAGRLTLRAHARTAGGRHRRRGPRRRHGDDRGAPATPPDQRAGPAAPAPRRPPRRERGGDDGVRRSGRPEPPGQPGRRVPPPRSHRRGPGDLRRRRHPARPGQPRSLQRCGVLGGGAGTHRHRAGRRPARRPRQRPAAARMDRLRPRPGRRRRPPGHAEPSRDGVTAVGVAAGDRHDAVDRRPARLDGPGTHRRAGRAPDRRRHRPPDARRPPGPRRAGVRRGDDS